MTELVYNKIDGNEKKITVLTCISTYYIPFVRLLGRSIKKYHPEWHLVVFLADQPPSWLDVKNESCDEIMALPHLDMGENLSWIFSHDVEELCTAVKPFVMDLLLSRPGVKACFYFDPDMVLFDRLDDLVSSFSTHDILLTPHQISPEATWEGIVDNEIGSLRHGIFNLGFLGVSNNENGKALLSWWKERLFNFCLARVDLHLWTDQKWFNHVPVFFDKVKILKDTRFNVAPWNLSNRIISISGGNFFVDKKRLGFYHFTGFNSGDHETQAARYAPGNKAVENLISSYKKDLNEEKKKIGSFSWAYENYANGEPIRLIHRIIYRYRQDLQKAYPNPFDPSGYLNWLNVEGKNEFGELVNFVEDKKLDIPQLPNANWIKSFPFPMKWPGSAIYKQDVLPLLSKSERRSFADVFRKLKYLVSNFLTSSEKRRYWLRMAKHTYRARGIRGIISRIMA
jgi:hypothetical protein